MSDLIRKALYLGVGIANYAAEKAGSNLQELKVQSQKLADELVERGKMTTEEAQRYVEELLREAQLSGANKPRDSEATASEPRRIEIVDDEDSDLVQTLHQTPQPPAGNEQSVDALRQQVEALQAELQRLRRSS